MPVPLCSHPNFNRALLGRFLRKVFDFNGVDWHKLRFVSGPICKMFNRINGVAWTRSLA